MTEDKSQPEARHTPGPWTISEANLPDKYEVGIRGGDDDAFIICDITNDGYSPEVNKANAELIARAPELAAENLALKAEVHHAQNTMHIQLEMIRARNIEIERLKETLKACRALMKYGKNDIDPHAPIWDQIEHVLNPPKP